MRIEFASPPPRLAALVSVFYRLRMGQGEASGLERADRAHIRCQLKGRLEHGNAGESTSQGDVTFCGPRMRGGKWRASGPVDLFGFALSPLGWARIVAIPAHHCTNRHLDGGAALNGQGLHLLHGLKRMRDMTAMVEHSCAFIDARVADRRVPADHDRLIGAVERWLEQSDSARIEDMFASQPWSPRQTTRLVNHYFGAPPKLLQRRARALRATAAILNGARPADMVGAFYDQPHMINEIKMFTGCTPGGLRRAFDPFSMASLSGRLSAPALHANDR